MERVESPTDLTVRAWWHALRDAAKRFNERQLTDRAAALTYYSVLSVFPMLIVLVALLGVLGTEETISSFLRIVDQVGPESAVDAFEEPVANIVRSSGGAGVALALGAAVALWSASSYVGAFIRASNAIYGVDEERPFYLVRPLQLLITFVMVVVLSLVLIALVLTGPLAEAIWDEVGLGDTAQTVWSIVKWPFLFLAVVTVIGLLYRVSPNARHVGLNWILPGSLLATVLWLIASAGFAAYVANFGAYSNTYGGLAGVIVFLIWIWLTNVAVLFGAQFAAELERTAAAATSAPGAARDAVPLTDPPVSESG
jgi:membrane protein